mmetsp:Transcript_3545/g.9113  ORF Transcript_3545/g.9113 Transcript_3545/m.9113 type:complete len:161 (+) Transcript_3545:3-485(+)
MVDDVAEFDENNLAQLHQFVLFVESEHPELHAQWCDRMFVEKLRRVYISHTSRPSKLRSDISAVLSEIGWDHDVEYVTEDGLLLDMSQLGSKLVIEVDGPWRYMYNPTTDKWVENGLTRLKSRLLEARGWKVLHIPFFEWSPLESHERAPYLEAKLAAAR